jgi:hypothetical protein
MSAPPDIGARAILLKRTLIAAATAFLAINIWTGAPILALWVGSQVVGKQELSMAAVFVVVIVLAVLVFAMSVALAWLNASYNQLTGRRQGEGRLAWLRSMNTPQDEADGAPIATSAVEMIVTASVYIAVIALVVWFFLFAGSPLAG